MTWIWFGLNVKPRPAHCLLMSNATSHWRLHNETGFKFAPIRMEEKQKIANHIYTALMAGPTKSCTVVTS